MKIREVVAANVRSLRQAKGLSQEELAHRAKLDRTYISSLERQVYGVSVDVLERLAVALEVETEDLVRAPDRRVAKHD